MLYRWRLHPEQTSRWSSCYSPEQFRRARAHFLARTLRSSGRPLWILGAGPTGKRLAKALAAEGLEPTAFADVDPRKIGGHVALGARCAPRWPVRSMDDLFAARPRPIAIAAVGQLGARERIRHWLCSRGWSETEDFWVAA
ncbi:MAG: hypothetical protein D6815_02420 [Candidatus Dadabacteria bacterium]|nr:MAG: hypothetical protein D6815_02420 [Candidatus Dadabacteria bacterium]